MKLPRVLMADDHSLILAGLRKLVEVECDVVGTVEDGRALMEAAQMLRPDLILLDISMPLLNGLEVARQLREPGAGEQTRSFSPCTPAPPMRPKRSRPGPPGIFSSAPRRQNSAWRSGQSSKANTISPRCSRKMCWTRSSSPSTGERGKPVSPRLTARQREVLQLVAEGHGTKAIATILRVSVKTVEFHKSHIMQHLDLHTTADLTKYAITHGITGL